MTHHYNTFRDQLAIAHPAFGYALWEPDPGEQYPPVEVGDVGFIRRGKFIRLFNALLLEDDDSHQIFGVPEGHEPLRLSTPNHVDRATVDPNNFCSHGVILESGGSEIQAAGPPTSDSAEVAFLCRRKEGAALSLPVVARREDTLHQAHFGTWLIRHIDSWFAFSQRHGMGIQMEDIVLVTGCHRTRSRSNIVFYDSQVDSRVSLRVQTPGIGTTVHWQVLSQRIQGAMLSHGPSGENLPQNQCLFIRGFRAKRPFGILPRRLRAAAEPKPDPEREPELELVPIPSVTERRDPLHVLLDYIATRAPGCDMALVHDDDLVTILGVGDGISLETLQPDVVMDYLQRSKFEIEVMSDSWTANNESTITNTESIRVAMLSEQLPSFNHRDSELLAAGGTSDIDLDPGNKSGVVVTDVELENIAPGDVPQHTFGLKQQSSTTMSSPPQTAGPSHSNLKSMLDTALADYKKKTGKDLYALWFASDLQTCESVDAVLDILRHQAKVIERTGDQKLMRWIDPLVQVLHTFSDALGDGVCLAFPPARVIFTGIGVLLDAAKDARASHGAVIDLFERIDSFFKRLEVYTQVSLTTKMTEVFVNIVIELLSILSIATKEVKRPHARLFSRKLLGRTDIEDAFKRLDSLIQEEVQMVIAQILKFSTEVKDDADKTDVDIQPWSRSTTEEVRRNVEEPKRTQIEQDSVTSNVVPSRSATILPILTPNRLRLPVSDQVLDFLKKAASDPESLLRPAKDGTVSAGNLEGLLSRAISGSGYPSRDERFKDTFLTIYQLFATSERLFEILKRRFEVTSLDPTMASSRYSILLFVESWLKKGFEDPELTCSSKIREFACSVTSSQTMEEKAREIARLVDDPDHVRLRNPGSCTPLQREPAPRPPGLTPSDVANAFTVIEGNRFERITYWDYVNFLRQHPNTQRLDEFDAVHDLIKSWVQRTVLGIEYVDERMKEYEFWIYTAQACRKLNNFSSTSAIVTTLLSPTIANLTLTCDNKTAEQVLRGLAKELSDASYRNVIHNAGTKQLIPWIDPHLTYLNSTFVQSNPIMEVDGHPLIDFKLFSELAEQVDTIVQYTPPRIEHATRQDVLAYLEYCLESSATGDNSHVSMNDLSAKLALEETRMFKTREWLRTLGLPWSPPRRK